MTVADKYPNWFAVTAQHNFEKHLLPFVGQEGLHFLQLGVYTGDATEFLCKNILTGKNSWLHDVDTWEGSDEEVYVITGIGQLFYQFSDGIGERKGLELLSLSK